MCLQDEKTYHHWVIGLFQNWMAAAEHFCQPDLVIITLSHLSAIDGDHIVMYPVANGCMMIADSALRYLTFMVRKHQVHATAVYVKLPPKVLGSHCRTLDMPPRETNTPGTLPTHDMFWRRIFP